MGARANSATMAPVSGVMPAASVTSPVLAQNSSNEMPITGSGTRELAVLLRQISPYSHESRPTAGQRFAREAKASDFAPDGHHGTRHYRRFDQDLCAEHP